jgi:RNA-directed DNA polymerase
MRKEWRTLKGKPVQKVVEKLNPIIRGWVDYNRHQVAAKTFGDMDNWMFMRECHYAKHTHPGRSSKWRTERYWGRLNKKRKDNWVFGDKHSGMYLLKYKWAKIERHYKVKGTASPDDPSLKEYWKERTKAKSKELPPSYQKIAQNQDHVCPICGEALYNDEELQKDHIQPRGKGGKESYENYQLLHKDCHKQKTAVEQSKREPTRKWLRKWLA